MTGNVAKKKGESTEIESLSVSLNGTYTAPQGTAYSPVTVSVPDSEEVQAALDSLIGRSITEVESNVTSVGKYAFDSCSQLATVNFPLATSIGDYAFNSCNQLTTANFPLLTSIGWYAFANCTSRLRTVDFPLVTIVGNGSFRYDYQLTTVNFPLATSIGDYAFNSCTQLTTANFPLVTSISGFAFEGCTRLTTVNFSAATSIGQSAFIRCGQLTTVDFPLVTSISSSVFGRCSMLTTVILRANQVATLSNINAFTGSPFASDGTGGTLYVPQALIEDYQNATNWSTILAYPNNQILPIEGSEYDVSN